MYVCMSREGDAVETGVFYQIGGRRRKREREKLEEKERKEKKEERQTEGAWKGGWRERRKKWGEERSSA